jgi:hypothetical protein
MTYNQNAMKSHIVNGLKVQKDSTVPSISACPLSRRMMTSLANWISIRTWLHIKYIIVKKGSIIK